MVGPWQIILLLIVVCIIILPTIIALIDILRNKFDENNKIIWLLVVLFTSVFGAILYFFIGRKQKLSIPKKEILNHL